MYVFVFQLKLVMGGLNANIEVEVPITIGTIPLMPQAPGFVVPPESSQNPPLFARSIPPQPAQAEQPPAYGAGEYSYNKHFILKSSFFTVILYSEHPVIECTKMKSLTKVAGRQSTNKFSDFVGNSI